MIYLSLRGSAPGYAIGSLGAYWTIQRTLMMFAVI
jgi:hypothetical protein